MSAAFYDLGRADDLDAGIRDLRGFWKLWSACLMTRLGLPMLKGIVVTRAYAGMDEALQSFLVKEKCDAVLIRHDKRPETPPHPRGGFLAGKEMLGEVVEFFFNLGRIVAIYEPANPLLNSYNMNLLFENQREVFVEVVGPGFDASDLQRGDISPHEALSLSLNADGTIAEMRVISRVDQAVYEESVRLRKEKIRQKLDSAPSEVLAQKIKTDLRIPSDVEAYLSQIGSPLYTSESYRHLPEAILRDTVAKIIESNIRERYMESTGVGYPLNFSTSLVDSGRRQVFWDIVSPALKFEGLKKAK